MRAQAGHASIYITSRYTVRYQGCRELVAGFFLTARDPCGLLMQVAGDGARLREALIGDFCERRDDGDHPPPFAPLSIDLIDGLRQIRLGLQNRAAKFEHHNGRIHTILPHSFRLFTASTRAGGTAADRDKGRQAGIKKPARQSSSRVASL
jgi:hypothetical protein